MTKLLTKSMVIALLLCAMLVGGVMWGRHSTTSVIKLKINEETGKPYAEEDAQATEPEDYIIARKININSASAEMLAVLPGIGDELANRIIDYRTEHGPFLSIEELCNVHGIGEKKLDAIRKYITAS